MPAENSIVPTGRRSFLYGSRAKFRPEVWLFVNGQSGPCGQNCGQSLEEVAAAVALTAIQKSISAQLSVDGDQQVRNSGFCQKAVRKARKRVVMDQRLA
jgi:hypothetical protein